ncbi:cytochrome P450 4C1-like [Belonocnema kinseyi]|uniref:cytochrome P450 4C1-like n=1 Tax=Belonocnema kinseyi TaxID=2817044 RepID=UPI00143D1C99|nr:cytochrome P450 4C1-like [Belonocnema kinseyi]
MHPTEEERCFRTQRNIKFQVFLRSKDLAELNDDLRGFFSELWTINCSEYNKARAFADVNCKTKKTVDHKTKRYASTQHRLGNTKLLTCVKNIEKGNVYQILQPWLDTELLTSTGNKWQRRRKLITSAFNFNIMLEFIPIFVEHGEDLVKDLKAEEGETEDLIPFLTKYTLNKLRWNFQTLALLKQNILVNFLWSQTVKIIEYSAQLYKHQIRKRMAMLDTLILAHAEGEINNEGIREEVDTFVYEGHDTTATAIFFTLSLLVGHKEIQEHARNEVDGVLSVSNGKIGLAEIQEFKYLERCIKEASRLYPSVPFISRNIRQDLQLSTRVKKKTLLHLLVLTFISTSMIFRHPNFWPNPHKFEPDRFLSERIQDRRPYSYSS